jgi:hypothetical protein
MPRPHSGRSPHLSRYRYCLKPPCAYSKDSHLKAMWDCGATEYRNRYHDLPIDTLTCVHFFSESHDPLKYSGYNTQVGTKPNTSFDHISSAILEKFGATNDHCDLPFCSSFQKQEAGLPWSKRAAKKQTLAIYDGL